MSKEKTYQKIMNKLIEIDRKFTEIEMIAKMLTIWIKEKDFEIVPVMEILNNKIEDAAKIIRKF